MIHNDVLRRLRYALRLNDKATIQLFALADCKMESSYLDSMMKRDTEDGFLPCRDKTLAQFLDGLIIKKRGKQEGRSPEPLPKGVKLTNNDILRKIKIAMNYKEEDMLQLLRLARFPISKNELSALFRNPQHRNYKPCGDQLLRNFLQGMVKKYRPDSVETSKESVWGKA